MAATLTIGGGFNSQTGIVSVPSSFPGSTSTSGSFNQILQNYFVSLSASLQGGTYAFENNDIVGGSDFFTVPASASGFFEEFTNTDSNGSVTGGSVSGAYTVATDVTDLVVQAPGNVTLTGNGTTRYALFGANSNVTYDQTTGGSAAIAAAGGKNAINVTAANVNDTVFSSGNDSVTFNGTGGQDVVNAEGNATTSVFLGGSDVATVTASDSAQSAVAFEPLSGGTLDFINSSTQAQTVYSGSYTTSGGGTVYAPNSITVNAGAGGGFYVGGRAGNNSLIGGSGAVTLVGGGTSDTLVGNGASNQLFGGTGIETLIGSSTSGSNVFQIGLDYVGIGQVTASGIASTNGSGLQSFIIGNTNGETLTGSTVNGSTNLYDVVGSDTGNLTTGGSSLTITNFGANSVIFLVDSTLNAASDTSIYSIQAAGGVGGGTDVYLNDGTTILLKGVNVSHVFSATTGSGIVGIGYQ
ncbi:MAG: beta strand repeat-containing protein [Acidocella sp.]